MISGLVLLQMQSVPVGTGLPSPATVLFNRPIRCLLPQMNRETINVDNDDSHYQALETCQKRYSKDSDTLTILVFLQVLQ